MAFISRHNTAGKSELHEDQTVEGSERDVCARDGTDRGSESEQIVTFGNRLPASSGYHEWTNRHIVALPKNHTHPRRFLLLRRARAHSGHCKVFCSRADSDAITGRPGRKGAVIFHSPRGEFFLGVSARAFFPRFGSGFSRIC